MSSSDPMRSLMQELQPICRSITGKGVRDSLEILSKQIPIKVTEVPSGSKVLDWTVPREWNIEDAYISGPDGRRIVSFRDNPLHVISYSCPIRQKMSFEQLEPHLYLHPTNKEWIPYRTTYYEEAWGFGVTGTQWEELSSLSELEVVIESTFDEKGSLTYGEAVVPGASSEEILIVSHICHPFMCNDNLSGIAVANELCRDLLAQNKEKQGRYTVRFLFAPATIGAITWLSNNKEHAKNIVAGVTLTCLGDHRQLTYKKTYHGDTLTDRAFARVLADRGVPFRVIDFYAYGYDERQFNSPGFRAPVGGLFRGQHGEFEEYHSSGDNMEFMSVDQLRDAKETLSDVVFCLQNNRIYRSTQPYAEPQLGKRGIYRSLGGVDLADVQLALFWILCAADGQNDLLAIADRSGLPFKTVVEAAHILSGADLLEEL